MFVFFDLLAPVVVVSEGPVDCRIIVDHAHLNSIPRVSSPVGRSLATY